MDAKPCVDPDSHPLASGRVTTVLVLCRQDELLPDSSFPLPYGKKVTSDLAGDDAVCLIVATGNVVARDVAWPVETR